jgi:ubiquinone/menaquinone biosynthesis C-methylase UbiE
VNTKRNIFYKLPPNWRFAIRRLYFLPSDILAKISSNKNLMPPKGLIYTGAGDFLKMGTQITNMFVKKHGLQPHHKVLDVGSGIGRLAIPLTTIIDTKGSYDGFDVIKIGTDWCTKNITKRFSNFVFKYVPLHNDLYNNDGQKANAFKFPYPDNSFDFGIANSLFTHMMPDEVQHYYNEIYRVLKPGGKFYATFFSVNKESRYTSNPIFSFNVIKNNYRLMDEKVTSANIAFDEYYLHNTIINPTKFNIIYKSYGYWSNETNAPNCEEYQDIVVVEKKGLETGSQFS